MVRERWRVALSGAGALLLGCSVLPARRAEAPRLPNGALSHRAATAQSRQTSAASSVSNTSANTSSARREPASTRDASGAAAAVASTVSALATVDLETDGFGLSAVPEAARPLLAQLTEQLRQLSERALSDAEGNSEQAEAAALAALRAAGVTLPPESRRWGSVLGLRIQQPAHHPELRIVTTTWSVPCGEDSGLYIYRGSRERWARILSRESDNPERTRAGNGLKYVLIEGAKGEPWAHFSASTASSCTSFWRPLTLWIQREPRPHAPELLAQSSTSAYYPAGFTLNTFGGGAELHWHGDLRFAPWYLRRGPESARYLLDEVGALQVPPLAGDPESVVLDWLDLPSTEAPRWLCAEARADAERVLALHPRLQNELPSLGMSPESDHCDGKPQTPPCIEVTLSLRTPSKARDVVKVQIQTQKHGQCVRAFSSTVAP